MNNSARQDRRTQKNHCLSPGVCGLAILLLFTCLNASHADQRVRLKNGLSLQGLLAEIASLNKNPFSQAAANGGSRPILFVDDGLRRVYVHRRGMVVGDPVQAPSIEALFEFKQLVANSKTGVAGIGSVYGVSPFDQYGRRFIKLRGPKGETLPLIQGITELNARYAKLESLKGIPSLSWDMRVATATLDSTTLRRIFARRVDQKNLNSRLEVVRFFIECDRYADAHAELETILIDFPVQGKELRTQLIGITEEQGRQLIQEAKRRIKAGQRGFAKRVYDGFPLNAVGRLTRTEIQVELAKLDKPDQDCKTLVQALKDQVALLKANQSAVLTPIVQEIEAGLSADTLPRLNDYSRLRDAQNLPLDSRVSLAISGWILGQNANQQNLKVAVALIQIRGLVFEYLSTANAPRREAILEQLRNLEGAQPEYVARMLPLLPPVKPWLDGAGKSTGMHVVGPPEDARDPAIVVPDYTIQLPPEYNPLRSYPCIIAVGAPGVSPEQQIDWWAGPIDPRTGDRAGRAARNGYIVVAPRWTRPGQRTYEYTPREQQRVLVAMRDAMRRASIDSDRVFIAGHDGGATAAFDIAVSHPDLWAGLVSFNAEPKKTLDHYGPNGEHVPMYFVMGELDGAPMPLIRIGPTLDRYVKVRNDVMIVMYRGRPSGYFPEELPQIFDWLNLQTHTRKPIPQKIAAKTMRDGDSFFWWLELDQFKPGTAIDPILWDQAEKIRAAPVEASVGADNNIRIGQGPTDRFHIWLAPEMGVDLSKAITIRLRTRRFDFEFKGELKTLLEDTRRRADRKRPFWAHVSIP